MQREIDAAGRDSDGNGQPQRGQPGTGRRVGVIVVQHVRAEPRGLRACSTGRGGQTVARKREHGETFRLHPLGEGPAATGRVRTSWPRRRKPCASR